LHDFRVNLGPLVQNSRTDGTPSNSNKGNIVNLNPVAGRSHGAHTKTLEFMVMNLMISILYTTFQFFCHAGGGTRPMGEFGVAVVFPFQDSDITLAILLD
jgi:hypothetical protein